MPGKEKADTTKSELDYHYIELRLNLVIRVNMKRPPIVRALLSYKIFN